MRAVWFSFLCVGLSLLVCSAGCHARNAAQASTVAQPSAASSAEFNDAARFLAGLPGRADGPYRRLEGDPAWIRYSQSFDQLWQQVQRAQLQPVANFQQKELSGAAGGNYVFYPFSGPDVLYATAFFPQAQHFVLASLEPTGSLRPAAAYTPESLPHELEGWSHALHSIFHRSFFITGEMTRQFHGRVATGLLPTMLLLLARGGNTIDNVQYVHLTPEGKLDHEAVSPFAPGGAAHTGVAITFHRNTETQLRTIHFFSTDLGPGFATQPAFSRYLTNEGHPDTFIKSASFLLHWRMCDPLREFLLQQSNLLLQDDTGVPFNYLQRANWNVQLYGQYSRPDHPFHKHYQKDLAGVFAERQNVRPLGFSLGYGYGRRPSSLIVARRKSS